eukprot:TRINITY_DN1899_c0_g1_i11.p1 TRINITY_DN1899_c0_g1~~TRINITY_DN1899_c0_g1_i11.p1  ORF type:complete len:359 (+),score=67.58 TRINITY_DN1899_c0_g1_i11:200-1276(+)
MKIASLKNESKAIKTSLEKKENPFRRLVNEFQKTFLRHYRAQLHKLNLSSYKHDTCTRPLPRNNVPANSAAIIKIRKDAMINIDHFNRLIVRCISVFYRQILGEEKLVNLKECISTYVFCHVVKREVYYFLLLLYRVESSAEECVLSSKIDKMRDVTPQELGINPYLSLNETSSLLEVYKKAVLQSESKNNARKENALASEASIRDRLDKKPYEAAQNWLRKIVWTASPWKKLKLISQLNGVICDCVDAFWRGISVRSEKLTVDADQYISIMIYIIIQGKVTNIYSHTKFAADLALYELKPSYSNYCLVTLQACFSHLIEMGQSVVSASTRDGLQEQSSPIRSAAKNKEIRSFSEAPA